MSSLVACNGSQSSRAKLFQHGDGGGSARKADATAAVAAGGGDSDGAGRGDEGGSEEVPRHGSKAYKSALQEARAGPILLVDGIHGGQLGTMSMEEARALVAKEGSDAELVNVAEAKIGSPAVYKMVSKSKQRCVRAYTLTHTHTLAILRVHAATHR